MARTGLRMMPTFPSPSLKFRTVSFPQYGFKASISEGAFPRSSRVKLAPSIPRQARGLLPPSHASAPATYSPSGQSRHNVRVGRAHPRAAVQEATLFTPGVLGSGPSSVVSVHLSLLRPHPPVSQARGDFTGSPLIRHAFAVRERQGDPRDVPSFPCRAFPPCRRPYAGGAAVPSRCPRTAVSGSRALEPRRPPRLPPLPAIPGGMLTFDAASFASCCGPQVCPALLTGYDAGTLHAPLPSEDFVTPAFSLRPHGRRLGIRLDW